MRHTIAEWGLVVALVIALVSALIWIDAMYWRGLEQPLELIPAPTCACERIVFVSIPSWETTGNHGP